MKITCQTCAAKYTIADDKVRGKTVKIKCKKCGTSIVVNGENDAAQAGAPAETGAVEWMVNVADGDQRTVSPEQLAELVRAGTVTADTYVWRDGMADWVPLAEVAELASMLGGAAAPPSLRDAADEEDVPTRIGDASALLASAELAARNQVPAPQQHSFATAATVPAARKSAQRPAPDLFGAPKAMEEEMPTRVANPAEVAAPRGGGGASAGLTAARNESSTLFSLEALSGGSSAPKGAPAARRSESNHPAPMIADEKSGLIDIRHLQAQKPPPPKKNEKVDDVLNLGVGGPLFAPAISAPTLAPVDLSAPSPPAPPEPVAARPADVAAPMPMAAPQKSNKGLFIGIGAVALVAILGGGAVLAMGGKKSEKTASNDVTTASDTTTPKANDKPAETTQAAAPKDDKPADQAQPKADDKAADDKKDDDKKSAAEAAAERTPEQKKRDEEAAKKRKEQQDDDNKKKKDDKKEEAKKEEPKKDDAPPAAAAGGTDAPFDRGAAVSALNAAAGSVGGCKKADGPTGSGRVSVTFAPSGHVTSATVDGPPFAGTSVGGCVAARFRSAHVPPFGGGSVTVRKSFSIN